MLVTLVSYLNYLVNGLLGRNFGKILDCCKRPVLRPCRLAEPAMGCIERVVDRPFLKSDGVHLLTVV